MPRRSPLGSTTKVFSPRALLESLALAASCWAATACVTTGTYDAKVAELESVREQHDQAASEKQKELQDKVDGMNKQIEDLNKQIQDLQGSNAGLSSQRDGLRKQLDDATALINELKKRLEKLGQNVEKLTSENGQLAGSLNDTKSRLGELRMQKEAADKLAATFKNLLQELRSMIDAGQLKVVIREGRMLIAMPNDVLFDTGRTDIKPAAKATLTKVAQVLARVKDRNFLVAGDTDNVPIHTAQFPSNWELSTGRAVEVTKFLIGQGMRPEVLAAAGYGEFDPVAPNDTAERRALNRRIEIVLQPNLSELPALETVIASTQKT